MLIAEKPHGAGTSAMPSWSRPRSQERAEHPVSARPHRERLVSGGADSDFDHVAVGMREEREALCLQVGAIGAAAEVVLDRPRRSDGAASR